LEAAVRVVGATGLVLVAACSSLLGPAQATTYYAPTLSPDGSRLAYLKRVTEFRARPVGLAFGQELEFVVDRLQLCQTPRAVRQETCEEEWSLPLIKAVPAAKGDIDARLSWDGNRVRYRIRLIRFGASELGVPVANRGEGGERILTNADDANPWRASPTPQGWRVGTTADPATTAYPIDNAIVVEEQRP
jgi:hypothetical protein